MAIIYWSFVFFLFDVLSRLGFLHKLEKRQNWSVTDMFDLALEAF